MSKFITEAKQAKLERDGGKQTDPEHVTDLVFSDLVQRTNVAKTWGFNRSESSVLIKAGMRKWLAYNMEQLRDEQQTDGALQEQPERAPTDETNEG